MIAQQNEEYDKLPLVSIIISGYNYSEYLPKAVESALNQTYPNIELIVVDDGSTDNTQEILKKYNLKKILQTHQGFAAARNNGIQNSKGSFFLCLDGDDAISPKYIEATLSAILLSPKIAFVTTGSKIWYEETGFENVYMPRRIYFRYSVFAGWFGALGTVLMRRTAFDSLVSGFDSNLLAHEDLDLCFRLLKNWKSGLVFQPLHWYRRHKIVLSPETVETRRMASIYLDRKYPHRKSYRTIYGIYKQTIGRLVSFFRHPAKYLWSLREKTELKVQFNRIVLSDKPKIGDFYKQIVETIDMQLEWSNDKDLWLYYEKKIAYLKSRIFNVIPE